jgi:hypothetical protein
MGQSDPERLTLKVETRIEGQWQAWFCHAACFRERLVEMPGMEPQFF